MSAARNLAKFLAALIDALATYCAVGAGEINIFKNARARLRGREGLNTFQPVFRDYYNFAIFHFADEFCADDI